MKERENVMGNEISKEITILRERLESCLQQFVGADQVGKEIVSLKDKIEECFKTLKPTVDSNVEESDLVYFLSEVDKAGARSRSLIVTIVIVSVLVFISFFSSWNQGWIKQRMEQLKDPRSNYSMKILGISPNEQEEWKQYCKIYFETKETSDKVKPIDMNLKMKEYQRLCDELHKLYTDNVYTVKIPFLNLVFDKNDLGVFGGIWLLSVLVLLRLSIRSEQIALRVAFDTAYSKYKHNLEKMRNFYNKLALNQVFTLPHLKNRYIPELSGKQFYWFGSFEEKVKPVEWQTSRRWYLQLFTKLPFLFPICAQLAILLNDYVTYDTGGAVNPLYTKCSFLTSLVLLGLTVILAVACFKKTLEIDRIWQLMDLVIGGNTSLFISEGQDKN